MFTSAWFWSDSRFVGRCRSCRCVLIFYQNAETGRWRPFAGAPRIIETEVRRGAQALHLDLFHSHLACHRKGDRP